jgi:hypothetical protein
VSVIVQVEQLVAPLCHDSEGVFEECHHDEEAADCWEVSVQAWLLAMLPSDSKELLVST